MPTDQDRLMHGRDLPSGGEEIVKEDAMDRTCETCGGRGSTGPVHINRGDAPHEWRESMPCRDCDGTGRWTAERHARWQAGRKMRAERLARGESLREAAQRMGITPARLCDIEAGRAAPESSHD